MCELKVDCAFGAKKRAFDIDQAQGKLNSSSSNKTPTTIHINAALMKVQN